MPIAVRALPMRTRNRQRSARGSAFGPVPIFVFAFIIIAVSPRCRDGETGTWMLTALNKLVNDAELEPKATQSFSNSQTDDDCAVNLPEARS
jgi:hypothetical protein